MIEKTAVYYRDLNNGPWFGISEDEQFAPGTLLKLPIAIALYRWEQRSEGVLDKQITFKGFLTRPTDPGSYGTDTLLPPGVYNVRDLVGIMLRESSNDAAQILADYAGNERLSGVYADLGIAPPQDGGTYTTDAHDYGGFFRILFNASYLGQPASEAILATLTQAEFRSGLVAGVPAGTVVAHKFGTRVVGGIRQLHDCGIVYAPKQPYVLCVMTQGLNLKNLEYVISDVSRRVWKSVAE